MKILFITDRVDSKANPILFLAENVENIWKKDHTTYFLGNRLKKNNKNEFIFYYSLDEKVQKLYFSLEGLSPLKKLFSLLRHPILSFFGLFKKFNIDLIVLNYIKYIKGLDKKYNFDCFISLSAPYYTAKALSRYKTDKPKIIWMMDPYSTHFLFSNKRTHRKEAHCIDNVTKVYVPFELIEDYTKKHFINYAHKIEAIGFPALLPIPHKTTRKLLPENKINLLYAGSFYSTIRSPKYLFSLINTLKEYNFHLTLLGADISQFPSACIKQYSSLKDYITILPPVSPEEVTEYIASADILVNLGNTVENMLPSKIIQYFGTGKPILNIGGIENCCTKKYIAKYPLAVHFSPSDFKKSAIILEKKDELLRLVDRQIPYDTVVEIFPEFTPKKVANQLLNGISPQ